ncbi:STAS-like domain-containing protein [Ethanoligenens harbinense]|uniref:DUF4325 domain-containing protein n=1 Tax=Ethanoligenens harbinense (strain DSM 18485 / JCM 12961 / CGMCC 1.5033 / YUAN-3) TaxID=663278 RepID=E6U4T1_ETHHY|nr:STAS-like domain-containing protein [Ethanoligenens harbinense]ADU27816.1 hypothetical protein Ethha_2304 [Ethanoligenens harbinense YUAN-3]AVQ96841.1 DUF4325 domain-containing protein [Ethanoligenens harbinense YUAN-3]AYF39503.1 DUF4325 domain-containing protein [Ethanoligenens harbinense]AYF42328.1 DUF4325 domain-containing protein [Ethanoligenens harbinense]QCN93082.1 DUF4325 domain-containing protein [Ethanoligenens harbinense]
MQKVMVRDIATMALTESDGRKLRKAIEASLKDGETVELDFSGISLFATMFFNASIGNFVMKLSPDECAEKIRLTNISDLGMDTYLHSFENASAIYAQQETLIKISDITQSNITDN